MGGLARNKENIIAQIKIPTGRPALKHGTHLSSIFHRVIITYACV